MTCPRCNAKITASDRYCVNCGADIALISQNIRPADVLEEEEPYSGTAGSGWSTASGLDAVQGPGGRGGRIAVLVVVHLCLFLGSAYAAHWYMGSRAPQKAPVNPGLALGKPRLVTPGVPDEPAPAVTDEPEADRPRRKARRPRRTQKKKSGPVAAKPAATAPGKVAPDPTAPKEPAPVAKAEPTGEPAKTEPAKTEPAKTEPASAAQPHPGASGGGEDRRAEPAKTEPGKVAKATPPAKMGSAEKFAVSLNVGSVQMVVRHRLPQLRLCYGRNIKGLAVSGVVEIKFTVNEQGRVSSASVHRGHLAVGKCIVGKLKTWRFPRPVGGEMTFIYPFKITS